MTIHDLFPDDYKHGNFIAADIWREDSHGCNHRMLCNHGLNSFITTIPDFIPRVYKRRKIRSVLIQLDSLDNVKFIDARYGNYTYRSGGAGYVIRHLYDFFGSRSELDVSKAYRV